MTRVNPGETGRTLAAEWRLDHGTKAQQIDELWIADDLLVAQ